MSWRMAAIAACLAISGCLVSEDRAVRVLGDAGYSHVVVGLSSFFSCSDDDTLTREFKAIGPSGKSVSGALCCGFWKNCTIRLD